LLHYRGPENLRSMRRPFADSGSGRAAFFRHTSIRKARRFCASRHIYFFADEIFA
jgi:hypothetical protein